MAKMQLFGALVIALLVTASSAQDPATNELSDSASFLDDSESGDGTFSSFGDNDASTSTTGSDNAGEVDVQPETLAPTWTIPPVVLPVVDGVKMFGQCGGIFYSGTTACADPDAYCKQLSIYSSICSPRPVD